jgi:hypothetical protein
MALKRIDNGFEALRIFLDRALGVSMLSGQNSVSGRQLTAAMVSAASHNTYIETVSDKADTLNRRIKATVTSMIMYSYLEQIKRLAKTKGWIDKNVVFAIDYTEENYYGEVQGFDIHGWTGERGITGQFKFLTCSIVSDEIPEKIPLLSVPIMLGHYKSHIINYLLTQVAPMFAKIDLILFDRGFYDKDLMFELDKASYPYLIFVPKQKNKQEILYGLEDGDHVAINNEFTINMNKTQYYDENYLVFLKQIYCDKSETAYDWVFATNVENIALGNIITTYKKRWRIETGFRVQDDATIKCKSKDLQTRYFLFLFTQLLQADWMCFYKEEVSFKKFLIELDTFGQRITSKL